MIIIVSSVVIITSIFLTVNDRSSHIKFSDTIKILGYIFDRRLNWRHHLNYVTNKASRRLNALMTVGGKVIGVKQRVLKTIYQSCILPVLLRGSELISHWSSTSKSQLEKVHFRAARLIIGLPNGSPSLACLLLAGLQPIESLTSYQHSVFVQRILLNPVHQATVIFNRTTSRRLENRKMLLDPSETSTEQSQPVTEHNLIRCDIPPSRWEMPAVFSSNTLPSLPPNPSPAQRSAAAQFTLDEYPRDSWIRVFCDGSINTPFNNAIGGGVGVVIDDLAGMRSEYIGYVESVSTPFEIEVTALFFSMKSLLSGNLNLSGSKIVIFTDNQSIIIIIIIIICVYIVH
jgi:hypothetical protein